MVGRHLRQVFDQRMESIGPTRAKWTAVLAVAENPGATQRMIASALHVTEVTAGRLIDRLCSDGLLERREHPQDRRAYRVLLTEAATPMLARSDEIASIGEAEAFNGFDEQELTDLQGYLERIQLNLMNARAEASPGRPLTEDSLPPKLLRLPKT